LKNKLPLNMKNEIAIERNFVENIT
jgi:hypothetical protein